MSRRTTAIAAALSVLALGSPLISSCANPLANNSYNSGVEKYEQGLDGKLFNEKVMPHFINNSAGVKKVS